MAYRNPAALVIICCALLSSAEHACADEIKVAVAANFAETLRAIATRFNAGSNDRVIPISGSTGKLYAQIVNGAPFDLFFAADSERPALLEADGRSVADSRFSYALGRLVVWSPDPDLVDPSGQVLLGNDFRFLAIANPKLAPYGKAAQEVLTNLGRWDSLQSKLVRGENINQALQFVVSGNAQLGILARAQLGRNDSLPAGSVWNVPASSHAPIVQQAILINDTAAGRAFLNFVRSAEGRSIIAAHGYDLPNQDTAKF